MNIKTFTAVSIMTAAGLVAGCSDQSESEMAETDAAEQNQPQGTPSTPADTGDQSTMARTQQSPMEEPADPAAGEMPADESPAATEFAAFDTDSDGKLGEDEWRSNAEPNATNLRNMTFDQIDRDANGSIDLREFKSAKTSDESESSSSSGASTSLDPTAP